MAYGLSMTGASGTYQLDSSGTARFLFPKLGPTNVAAGSSNNIVGSTMWDRDNNDLLFAKPQGTSTTNMAAGNFLRLIPDYANGTAYFTQPASIIVLEITDRAVANDSGGDSNVNGTSYGLQITNSAGAIIIDSRKFNKAMEFIQITDPGYYYGMAQTSDGPIEPASPNTNVVYNAGNTTTLSKAYMMLNGSRYLTAISQSSFYYDYANSKIYYEGYIDLGVMGGTQPLTNGGSIVIGNIRE